MAGKNTPTVLDLVSQVRSQLDEENRDTVDDEEDILPALNRGLDYSTSILARHYEEALLAPVLELDPGVVGAPIPEDAFEDRIEAVEWVVGGSSYLLTRVGFRDAARISANLLPGAAPAYYTVRGRDLQVLSGGGSPAGFARLHYLRTPDPLVLPQGRIQVVSSASNYVVVDSVGEDLTTETDSLASYVSLADGATGLVKRTMQVQSITGGRVTFRSAPTRTSVLGRDVEDTIGTSVEADDYLCLAPGTCVPQFSRPVMNFLVQFAVSELTRKLGGAADSEESILKKFEAQVEHTWAGRESTIRISRVSPVWNSRRPT